MTAAPKRARVAPKRAPTPAAPEPAGMPAVPVTGSVPAPSIVEHQIAKPILNDGGSAIERAFLSKSPAVVGMSRQGLLREVTETQGQAARVAVPDRTHLNSDPAHSAAESQPMDELVTPGTVRNIDPAPSAAESQPMDEAVAPERVPDLTHSAVERQPIDETVESDGAVMATGSRRTPRLAFLTLLLAATAASGYYYYDRSAQQRVHEQSAGQPLPSMPDGPISAGAAGTTVTTQVDGASAPMDATSPPTTRAEEVEKAPPPAARVVAKPRTGSEPVRPSSVIDGGAKNRKDLPILKECTEAVAALGLCSPIKP